LWLAPVGGGAGAAGRSEAGLGEGWHSGPKGGRASGRRDGEVQASQGCRDGPEGQTAGAAGTGPEAAAAQEGGRPDRGCPGRYVPAPPSPPRGSRRAGG
jgi:hypothetical protein